MMIRDFLNTEEDALDAVAEATACVRRADRCDFSAVDSFPLGMMYAPMQEFRKLYTPEDALCRGTLFCELDLPFRGGDKK